MMCEFGRMRMAEEHGACSCGCHGGFGRHFITKQEKIERLEEYKAQMEIELQAVKEELELLKST
jgi:hypothetical protein